MTAPVLRLDPKGYHRLIRRDTASLAGLPIGDILVRQGDLDPGHLLAALALQPRELRRLGDTLVAHRWASADAVEAALALQRGAERADLSREVPDPYLIDRLGATECIRLGVIPLCRAGAVTRVAVSSLSRARMQRDEIEAELGPTRFVLARRCEVEERLLACRRHALSRAAERRVPASESVRGFTGRLVPILLCLLALVAAAAWFAPKATFAVIAAWAVLCLLLTSLLRAAAAITQLWCAHGMRSGFASSRTRAADEALPHVSLIVPLFREREIAGRLVQRLVRLDYPEDLLDIVLVVEEDDVVTRETLKKARTPSWMRQVVVPAGTVRTKPRAMNYALDFCFGSIVGVYDAEDAPAPDQIRRVVARFRDLPPEVACLQGVLDFYNARTNWLSRCFTIDYATWFRIILPGIARMGLVIPLGGTTLFFRRGALDRLGGWDAHNVTEDADLGLRLARHGYRCELIDSVTEEEANCHAIPWIRQRSRWLKGYAMTWISHMRAPRRLLRDLGWWKFAGIQVLFLGTLSSFLLAPLIWSFWLLLLGLPHPLTDVVPWWLFVSLGGALLVTEVVNMGAAALAVSTPKHRWLIPWVPTMHLYHPLGAIASWKGLLEILVRPFYWDKTAHGRYGPERVTRDEPPLPRRV